MNDRVPERWRRKEAHLVYLGYIPRAVCRFGFRLKDKSWRILKADLPQAADAYKLARATRKKFVLRLSSAQTRPVVRLGGRFPPLPFDAVFPLPAAPPYPTDTS